MINSFFNIRLVYRNEESLGCTEIQKYKENYTSVILIVMKKKKKKTLREKTDAKEITCRRKQSRQGTLRVAPWNSGITTRTFIFCLIFSFSFANHTFLHTHRHASKHYCVFTLSKKNYIYIYITHRKAYSSPLPWLTNNYFFRAAFSAFLRIRSISFLSLRSRSTCARNSFNFLFKCDLSSPDMHRLLRSRDSRRNRLLPQIPLSIKRDAYRSKPMPDNHWQTWE